MKIIVCLDDHNGMMFNRRRLSQDVMVRKDIFQSLNGNKLFMNHYSYQMFKEDDFISKIVVVEALPIINNDFQFIEGLSLSQYVCDIDQIMIYYWNRKYPSDLKFDIDVHDGNWSLLLEEDIVGKSHEKITKKVFERITEG